MQCRPNMYRPTIHNNAEQYCTLYVLLRVRIHLLLFAYPITHNNSTTFIMRPNDRRKLQYKPPETLLYYQQDVMKLRVWELEKSAGLYCPNGNSDGNN